MYISLHSLTFAYRFNPGGNATLDKLNFEFDSAEAIGLLGQVGSGKSTLLKILAGAITPGKKMVFVDDEPFFPAPYIDPQTNERPWWSRCAYVAQRPEDQLVGRTVEQEIAYGLRNLRKQEDQVPRFRTERKKEVEPVLTPEQAEFPIAEIAAPPAKRFGLWPRANNAQLEARAVRSLAQKDADKAEIDARVAEVLTSAGLDPDLFRQRSLDDLSRGEKRRVALAAALALDPDMLLLDESLSNIDPAGHDALIATIQRAQRERQCGMLASSHRIEDILPFVERIVFLAAGGIVWDGPTGKFLEAWAAAWSDPHAPNADIFTTLNVPPLLETLFRLRAGGVDVPLSAAIVTAPELAAKVVTEALARRAQQDALTPDPSAIGSKKNTVGGEG